MSRELTIKERKFAELVVELGNQSEAYRQGGGVEEGSEKQLLRSGSEKGSERRVRKRLFIGAVLRGF